MGPSLKNMTCVQPTNRQVVTNALALPGVNDVLALINYYVCRAQALRDNLGFYKMVNGRRVALKKADGKADAVFQTPVAKAEWHTLRVEFQGNTFKATLDNQLVAEVQDDTLAEAGRVGVWTKADSVTLFDDFVVTPKP